MDRAADTLQYSRQQIDRAIEKAALKALAFRQAREQWNADHPSFPRDTEPTREHGYQAICERANAEDGPFGVYEVVRIYRSKTIYSLVSVATGNVLRLDQTCSTEYRQPKIHATREDAARDYAQMATVEIGRNARLIRELTEENEKMEQRRAAAQRLLGPLDGLSDAQLQALLTPTTK